MRGIVVSKLINMTRFGMAQQSELDPQNVRMWLLHWDKLEYPIGGFDRRISPDEEYLISAGAIQRTLAHESYLTSDVATPENGGFFNSTIDTYKFLENKEPGVWSLARTKLPESPWDHLEDRREFEETESTRGLYIRLISSVPVPEKDIPLEEVLEFKQRRESELLAFRSYVDELYQKVLASPDRPLAELSAVELIQKGAKDIVAAQPKFSWKWFDLSGKFNLVNATAAAITAHTAGLELIPTLVAAAAGAAIEVGPSFALKDSKQSASPFEYVARYHSEL